MARRRSVTRRRGRALAALARSGVMAILDGGATPPRRMPALAAALIRGGVRVMQLRVKGAPDREVLALIGAVRRAAPRGILLVNDRCDLAAAGHADGVHLGADDLPVAAARRLLGPDAVVGVSAGTPRETRAAVAGRPDYVSFGPAFRTRTKRDAGSPLGPAGVARLCRLLPPGLPALAVGGVDSHNGGSLVAAGVAAVAVASWWPRPGRAARAARELLAAVRIARKAAGGSRRTIAPW